MNSFLEILFLLLLLEECSRDAFHYELKSSEYWEGDLCFKVIREYIIHKWMNAFRETKYIEMQKLS